MMTPEQQLTAIIEAQVKGGHKKYEKLIRYPRGFVIAKGSMGVWYDIPDPESEEADDPKFFDFAEEFQPISALEILLDPAGLRSAYGSEQEFYHDIPCVMWDATSHAILDAWLSKPEGDALGAIKTAYELLPKA